MNGDQQGRAAQVPTMALFAQSHPSFPYQVVNQFRQNQVLGQLGQQFALRGQTPNISNISSMNHQIGGNHTINIPSPSPSQSTEVSRRGCNDEVPERKCLICGDRATGLHYGIISCEGCKGFFKRSICNRRVYRCSRDKQCMMSRKQRNRCQYCRLRKCLEQGMNRKAIREDGMPGGRNKSIGPVTLNEGEIERVLNGVEFEHERQLEIMPSPSPQAMPSLSTPSPQVSIGHTQHPNPAQMLSILNSNLNNPNHSHLSNSNSANNTSGLLQQPHNPFHLNQGVRLPQLPRTLPQATPQALPNVTRDDDDIATIIKLEDKTPPTPLVDANDKFAKYQTITNQILLQLLGQTADELLTRQIRWVKHLPFFEELTVKDYTTLISNTWAESMLLAALTTHRDIILDKLADITDRYKPTDEEKVRLGSSPNETELIHRINQMFNKFALLEITHEEYCIMKLINFLNHDIQGLNESVKVEAFNKKFWFLCQHWLAARQGPQQRFRDLITSIPEIRFVASSLKKVPAEKVALLFKTVLENCRLSHAHRRQQEAAQMVAQAASIAQQQQQQHQQQQQQQAAQQHQQTLHQQTVHQQHLLNINR